MCGSQKTACGIQNKAQVIRFGGQCLCLLSYVAGPKPLIFSTYDVFFLGHHSIISGEEFILSLQGQGTEGEEDCLEVVPRWA